MLHTNSLLVWSDDGGPEVQQPCHVRFSNDHQHLIIEYKHEDELWLYRGELKAGDTFEIRCDSPHYLLVGTFTLQGDNFYEGRWLQEQNGVKTSGLWSLDVA